MKFLCLGYLEAAKMDACSKEEIDAVMQECPPTWRSFIIAVK